MTAEKITEYLYLINANLKSNVLVYFYIIITNGL